MPKFTPAAVDRVFRRQVSSARELIPEILLDRLERLIQLVLSGFLAGVRHVDEVDRGSAAPRRVRPPQWLSFFDLPRRGIWRSRTFTLIRQLRRCGPKRHAERSAKQDRTRHGRYRIINGVETNDFVSMMLK